MKYLRSCVALLALLSFCGPQKVKAAPCCPCPPAPGASTVAVYYENWSQYRTGPGLGGRPVFFPNLIDPTIITDIYFAFGIFGWVSKSVNPDNPHLTGDYTIQPLEWNDKSVLYPQCMALKQQNPNLKVHLSIGGWSFNDPEDPTGMGQETLHLFSQMVASKANRTQFINSAIAYAKQYGFDGIDIDWEYPGDASRGGNPSDYDHFVTFLSECHTAFQAVNPPLILTYAAAAIPKGSLGSIQNPGPYFTWLARCAAHLDFINIMTYDYHGAFDFPKVTGVNAPLNQDTNPDSLFFVKQTVENYINFGSPPEKLVLGLPTYGRSFGGVTGLTDVNNSPGKPFTVPGNKGPATLSPGFLSYFEIADAIALKQLTPGTDTATSTALAYNLCDGQWVSFDTPETNTLKTQLAINNQLKGVMFWAVDNDEYQWGSKYPNIRAAFNLLNPSLASPILPTSAKQDAKRQAGLQKMVYVEENQAELLAPKSEQAKIAHQLSLSDGRNQQDGAQYPPQKYVAPTQSSGAACKQPDPKPKKHCCKRIVNPGIKLR